MLRLWSTWSSMQSILERTPRIVVERTMNANMLVAAKGEAPLLNDHMWIWDAQVQHIVLDGLRGDEGVAAGCDRSRKRNWSVRISWRGKLHFTH